MSSYNFKMQNAKRRMQNEGPLRSDFMSLRKTENCNYIIGHRQSLSEVLRFAF